jgi:hypothetical protein
MRNLSIVLAFVLFACALAATQEEDFSKVQMKVTKVAGNVYMLEGEGGNIGASIGEDGIVVIDDQYAPLAERIQAALSRGSHRRECVLPKAGTHHRARQCTQAAGKRRLRRQWRFCAFRRQAPAFGSAAHPNIRP